MKHRFDDMSVDSGMLAVIDSDWLESILGHAPDNRLGSNVLLSLPKHKGKVKVTLNLPDSWSGKKAITSTMTLGSSRKVWVGDPCYLFHFEPHEVWDKIGADGFEKPTDNYVSLSTGGDGLFRLLVTITKEKT